MKAIVWTQYGSPDGLRLTDIAKPQPKDNEILVRVHAATVTAGDSEIRQAKISPWLVLPMRLYMGLLRPRNIVLGQELAGVVEEVGSAVTRFKVGDAVFAATGIGFGGYAEYARVPENGAVALKPDGITFEEAATVPTAGIEALHFLSHANIQPGQKVLIVGAGGSIGTFAIQIAKARGAEVTGIDVAAKFDTMQAAGADHVIDYTQQDFTRLPETYDVVLDVMGKTPFTGTLRRINPNGHYLLATSGLIQKLRGLVTTMTGSKHVFASTPEQSAADLEALKQLIEAGKVKPVIDRSYPLEQTAEAHRYVDSGNKRGNVVITVA
ncbi:MAG: NAD(P)-dependent alcohol dehydrogenase [Chloroflexi bacterium]|nr:NAD(P)-dependent alcohol dehydrogenase [Chloroflexota bacterium]